MFGVVLWSDPSDGNAVFWCEDHGDLAYYDASTAQREAFFGLTAGDMVQFEVTSERRVRKAHTARLIQQQGYADLPASLRREGAQEAATPQSAQVIPFAASAKAQGQPRKKVSGEQA